VRRRRVALDYRVRIEVSFCLNVCRILTTASGNTKITTPKELAEHALSSTKFASPLSPLAHPQAHGLSEALLTR